MASDRVIATVNIDRDLWAAADKHAKKSERSKSAVVRIALREFLEGKANAQKPAR